MAVTTGRLVYVSESESDFQVQVLHVCLLRLKFQAKPEGWGPGRLGLRGLGRKSQLRRDVGTHPPLACFLIWHFNY